MQNWPDDLALLRRDCRAMLEGWSECDARAQYHPELSPLAWHVGHVFFVETYWLREIVCRDDRATAPWRTLYSPEQCPKGRRAERLPGCDELRAWSLALEAGNAAVWQRAAMGGHRLMANGYLQTFLAQHYAQHLETMAMVRAQRILTSAAPATGTALTTALDPAPAWRCIPAGETRLGGENAAAYDNELPAHRVAIAPFRLAAEPVTNAEWLAFMLAGGYRQPGCWTDAGRRWLGAAAPSHPQHWRAHPQGGWTSAAETLAPSAPVHGICAHEADAYARWAGARLPHEHEWEHAARQKPAFQRTGVWQWCANSLFPYPGFRAFPYSGYSAPWFDGDHRVLRGASRHTRDHVRRPSFRQFYPAGHRHVFAGLRLAC